MGGTGKGRLVDGIGLEPLPETRAAKGQTQHATKNKPLQNLEPPRPVISIDTQFGDRVINNRGVV